MGDVQQIPPIYGNSREETVEASIVSSREFAEWVQLRLTKQYRAASDPEWGEQNRKLGNGTADMLPHHEFNEAADGKRAVPMPLVTNLFERGQEEKVHLALPPCNHAATPCPLPASNTARLTLWPHLHHPGRRSSGCLAARRRASSTCTPASRRSCARGMRPATDGTPL